MAKSRKKRKRREPRQLKSDARAHRDEWRKANWPRAGRDWHFAAPAGPRMNDVRVELAPPLRTGTLLF